MKLVQKSRISSLVYIIFIDNTKRARPQPVMNIIMNRRIRTRNQFMLDRGRARPAVRLITTLKKFLVFLHEFYIGT